MAGVSRVSLSATPVGGGVYRLAADLEVIVYPYGSVPVEVAVVVDGRVYSRLTYTQRACGRPPDVPCPGRVETEVELSPGSHEVEVVARTRDRLYPDDFEANLRPREYWGAVYYPVVYVLCKGSTASPRKITRQDLFAGSVREQLWYYEWEDVRILAWDEVLLEYPRGYSALRSVSWEGTAAYTIGADKTVDGVSRECENFMRYYWELEESSCYACVKDVRVGYY